MRDLPAKRLPTAFAAWDYLKPSRPYLLPVVETPFLPPGQAPRLVSSVTGKIATIVLYYPGKQETKKGRPYCYSDFIEELMQRMGSEPRRFILAIENDYELPEELQNVLEAIATEYQHTLELVSMAYDQKTLSPWVQDAFLPIQFKEEETGIYQTYLVESVINNCFRDSTKALLTAADIKEFKGQQSHLPFVGGNILTGSNGTFALVGLHDTCRDLLEKIGEEWLGKNLIVVESQSPAFVKEWKRGRRTSDGILNFYQSASESQILFHLDLFITLAGKGRLKRKTEHLVIGQPVIGFEGHAESSATMQAMVERIITETSTAIEHIIDHLKKELETLGIRHKIVRNPLPLTYYEQEESIDRQVITTRYFCWATYNNCLVENYEKESFSPFQVETDNGVRRVYLPSYGISSDYSTHPDGTASPFGSWKELHQFDKENRTLWEKLDYEVILLEQDFNPFVRYQGSLNCLTNVIERT